MTVEAARLTVPQLWALRVLVAAHCREEPRPCRASNRTTPPAELGHREMLTVQHQVAHWFELAGIVRYTNTVLQTLELTDTGRALAQEAGLSAGGQLGGSRP